MAQDGDTELNKEIITRFIAPSFPKNCCTAISQAFLTQNKHVCLTRGLTLNRSGIDRAFYPAAALSKSKSYIECQSMTSLRVSHLNLFGANFAAVNSKYSAHVCQVGSWHYLLFLTSFLILVVVSLQLKVSTHPRWWRCRKPES